MSEKYEELRKMLIRFAADHAREKNVTQQMIADRTGWHQSHVGRLEAGKFPPTLDSFIRYCEAVGMRLEMHAEGSKSSYTTYNSAMPKFLFAPDHVNNQLYIVHTHYPACIIQVIQTIPHQLKAITLYAEEEDLSEVMEEAETFYRTYVEKMDEN